MIVITRLSIGTYPNVDFRATIRLAFKQLWSCIRWTPTPRFKTLSLLEYVTESKICKEEKIQPELLRTGKYLNSGNADVANDDDDDDRQALTVMALMLMMVMSVVMMKMMMSLNLMMMRVVMVVVTQIVTEAQIMAPDDDDDAGVDRMNMMMMMMNIN